MASNVLRFIGRWPRLIRGLLHSTMVHRIPILQSLVLRNARRKDGKQPPASRRTAVSSKCGTGLKRSFDEIERIRQQVKRPESVGVKNLIEEGPS